MKGDDERLGTEREREETRRGETVREIEGERELERRERV